MKHGLQARALAPMAVLLLALSACTGPTETSPSTSPVSTTLAVSTSPAVSSTELSTHRSATTTSIPLTSVEATALPSGATSLPMPAGSATVQAANPQEETDRAAVEMVWRRVWDLVTIINEIPLAERQARADALLLDPIRSQLLASAAKADSDGETFYGTIQLHPYWYRSIDGQNNAVIGDCRDASNFGSMIRATGEKRSVGIKGSNTVGRFLRGQDGSWKLWQVSYLTDLPCDPA
jgi:hypothetical protein